jgi:hypothetical protein
MLTLFFIVIGLVLIISYPGAMVYLFKEDMDKGYPSLVLGSILIGACAVVTSPSSFSKIGEVWEVGGEWSSVYTMHIPNAADFLHGYVADVMLDWVSLSFIESVEANFFTFIFISLALFFIVRGSYFIRKSQDFPTTGKALWLGSIALFSALFFHLIVFLSPYALSSLFALGRLWWLILVFIVLGLGGGGGKILYDDKGNKVGRLD